MREEERDKEGRAGGEEIKRGRQREVQSGRQDRAIREMAGR